MPPVVHVLADHEAVSRAIADRLARFVGERPESVLALPSGNTPVRAYELLAETGAQWGAATVFALDEYRGLAESDERSFRAFFRKHVFEPLQVSMQRRFVLDGTAPDPELEAARYEGAIAEAGGLDLTLLGLGANGHIAFNEPASTLQARTHVAILAAPANAVAPEGITMGVGTLLSAPQIWLMATGAGKAEAVACMLGGTVDASCPASVLQVHPNVEIFLDEAAASRL